MRDLPILNPSLCTGCGDCAAVCPVHCLAMAGPTPWLIRPRDCVSCAACVAICPANALRLRPLPSA